MPRLPPCLADAPGRHGTVRRELDLRAAHVLAEVHELALAYHWSEAEILARAHPGARTISPDPRMSDYLTRLARTALGWTQPLQPRVPFRFEPLSRTSRTPMRRPRQHPPAGAASDSAAASANQPREERQAGRCRPDRSKPPMNPQNCEETGQPLRSPPSLRVSARSWSQGCSPRRSTMAAPRRATATPAPSIADGSRRPSPAPSEPWPRA